MLTNVALEVFDNNRDRQYWVSLVGVESEYKSAAKSKTGAIGLGQLIVSYRNDFAKACGWGKADKSDLKDDYTNLMLSACYFRQMLRLTGGSVPLALLSYNQGPNSESLKRAFRIQAPNHEGAGHITKVLIHQERTQKELSK